jgi:hypothetical protein
MQFHLMDPVFLPPLLDPQGNVKIEGISILMTIALKKIMFHDHAPLITMPSIKPRTYFTTPRTMSDSGLSRDLMMIKFTLLNLLRNLQTRTSIAIQQKRWILPSVKT